MHNMNQWVPTPTPSQGSSTSTGPQGDGVIFASVVRDATGAGGGSVSGAYVSDWLSNPSARGVRVFVNIATGAATGTTTVKIQVQQPGSTVAWDLSGATTTALAGNTTGGQLLVYPDVPTGANISNNHLGSRWRVVATQALAPATFVVAADYLL